MRLIKRVLDSVLDAIDRRLPPLYRHHLASIHVAAGAPRGWSPAEVARRQLMMALAFGGAALALVSRAKGAEALGFVGLLLAPAFVLAGILLPYQTLRRLRVKRQKALLRALPFCFDLLILAVEAGLDFAQALSRVADRLDGPLRDELQTVLRELRLGKPRAEAVRAMAHRAALPAFERFATSLVQADRLGIPLGKALRMLGEQQRTERSQRAEKLANQAPVKLLFPLVTCFFPTLFMILFGPIAFHLLVTAR